MEHDKQVDKTKIPISIDCDNGTTTYVCEAA